MNPFRWLQCPLSAQQCRRKSDRAEDHTHSLQAVPAIRMQSGSTSRPRCRQVIWNLVLVTSALTVAYVAIRDEIPNPAAAWHAASWEASELTKPTPAIEQSLDKIESGRQGYFQPTLLYPRALIEVITSARQVKNGDRDDLDIFADFTALMTSWRSRVGDKPLILTSVQPSSTEPTTGRRLNAFNSPEEVTEGNFNDRLPLLRQITALILQGDGTGRGVLEPSGYYVEPEPESFDATTHHDWHRPFVRNMTGSRGEAQKPAEGLPFVR
jgi:hypothetical protein